MSIPKAPSTSLALVPFFTESNFNAGFVSRSTTYYSGPGHTTLHGLAGRDR